jgi:eukaryotic translation initiation factor 2C
MSTTPSVNIKQGRPNNLESSIRSFYKHSAEMIAQQGPKGHQLELLIIILPDMKGSYGKLLLNQFSG